MLLANVVKTYIVDYDVHRSPSGGFRPGPGEGHRPPSFAPGPPVSWPPIIFFCKDNTHFWFFAFPNFRKAAKFAASIERPKTKSASASGGVAPWPPDQRPCPWTQLGALPPDPRYRLALSRSPSGGHVPPRCCGLEPSLRSPQMYVLGTFTWKVLRTLTKRS